MVLTELMAKRDMTKYRLAMMAKIPHATLNDICSGKTKIEKCSAKTVYKPANALNVSMETLTEDGIRQSERERAYECNIHCENTIAINFYQLPNEATVSPAATLATTATSASALGETTLAETVVLPWLSTTGSELYDRALGTGSGLEQLNIMFDGEYQPQDYQLLNVKPDNETQKNTVLLRACLDQNGDVARRSLILSAAQLIKLAQTQQTEQMIFENAELP